jgi:hypothetical protein
MISARELQCRPLNLHSQTQQDGSHASSSYRRLSLYVQHMNQAHVTCLLISMICKLAGFLLTAAAAAGVPAG